MTGRERVERVLRGEKVDRPPLLPILHTALAPLAGVPLGRYFTDAEEMAGVAIEGFRRFGLDGVQLTLGVTGEVEALGAAVEQPADGAPLLRQHLLADPARLGGLRALDPTAGGRMPLFFAATERVARAIGTEAFVLPTLRGPLLMASQLRGVEQVLMDMMDDPEGLERILDFTTEVALRVGTALLATGAHGLALGEATCSPNFISPASYRRFVQPRHARLVAALKAAGWPAVGLHICGGTLPILEGVIATGVHFMDVDYQVPAADALALAGGRIALRGNLDPSALFRFGTPAQVREGTAGLARGVSGARWILSSGCDIPPGTPAENLTAFVEGAR